MIEAKRQEELRRKYNPDGSQLRKAQLRMVEMLSFIDKVCTENGLNYWLSFGTLLGAIRHEGFIPWDEDTDICMPVEDLKKFMQIMIYKNPSTEFVLQCHETDPNYYRTGWVVLRDLKSEYIQDNEFHKHLKYKGLQVDIFPVEKCVSCRLKNSVDFLETGLLMLPSISKKWYYKLLRPFRSIIWNILNHVIIPICHFYKKKNKNSYIVTYGVRIPYNYVGEESDIFPLERVPFESGLFCAPKDYEHYLTNLYGDWIKVPDESNIVTHNVEFVFK